MKFTGREFRDLAKAWAAISFAFAILISNTVGIARAFIVSAVTVGAGFLLHELAHKFVAQRYGCWAEFKASDMMLGIAIVSAFLGFIFAAPGAVVISGRVTKRQNGVISAAGPVTNIVLALAFWIAPVGGAIALYGGKINAFLALFNMIPFMGLDGQKVLAWNKQYYIVLIAVAFITFMVV